MPCLGSTYRTVKRNTKQTWKHSTSTENIIKMLCMNWSRLVLSMTISIIPFPYYKKKKNLKCCNQQMDYQSLKFCHEWDTWILQITYNCKIALKSWISTDANWWLAYSVHNEPWKKAVISQSLFYWDFPKIRTLKFSALYFFYFATLLFGWAMFSSWFQSHALTSLSNPCISSSTISHSLTYATHPQWPLN